MVDSELSHNNSLYLLTCRRKVRNVGLGGQKELLVNQDGSQGREKESMAGLLDAMDGVASDSPGTLFETERGQLRGRSVNLCRTATKSKTSRTEILRVCVNR